MNIRRPLKEAPRIAVIWPDADMQTREIYHALCRSNDRGPGVTLQRFALPPPDARRPWLLTLQNWKPQGVLMHTAAWDLLKKIRRALPNVPFVSTLVSPPELANTCVVTDVDELMTQARDYFLSRGLRNIALYCCADGHAVESRTAAFRAAVPNGCELVCNRGDQPGGYKAIHVWIQALPKPVGVVCAELIGACFLLTRCLDLGLRVPQDVQIIGVDDADECLAQTPHLTAFELPGRRIGEVALETMLRLVRKEIPAPPPVIHVSGSRLVARESTGLVRAGRSSTRIAIKHIQQSTSKRLPVARMARLAGVSRTTFYKEFSEATGQSPARHLRQLRLQQACRLLRESTDTVTDIAADCGFRSLIYFTQFFHRVMGETPTAYRRRMSGTRTTCPAG
jgi:LacI family transcriptional regulator